MLKDKILIQFKLGVYNIHEIAQNENVSAYQVAYDIQLMLEEKIIKKQYYQDKNIYVIL